MEERSPLSFPAFRSIWTANLASNFGSMVQLVGASWLMAASGAPPHMIALVQAFTSLPIVLVALPAGAIADTSDKRRVMLWAQCFLLLVSATLALLAWLGHATPWLLLAFTFLIGVGTALNGPAWQASVGDLVPRTVLPNAVAYNAMSMNVARSLGPALGGAIVALAGGAAAFLVNALSTIGLVVSLARWRPPHHHRVLPPERLGEAIGAGLRYAAMSPHLRIVLVRTTLVGFAMSPLPALMPLVARDLLHGGPLTYGILLGSFGVGAVGAALSVKRIRQSMAPEAIVRLSTVLTAIGAAGAALCPIPWLLCPLLTLAGAGWVMAFATMNVTVQLSSPRWVTARSLAIYQVAVYAGMAAGSWTFGLLAGPLGVAHALGLSALLNGALLLLALFLPLAAFDNQDMDPSGAWQVPETAVPIRMRSGPIAISIEYRIREAQVPALLAVMSERRRIRVRDGALGWTLLRDLADPELWVERYRVPTWLDYVRHNSRRTKADEANSAALRALWAGGSEPVVRRMIERPAGSLQVDVDDEAEPQPTRPTGPY